MITSLIQLPRPVLRNIHHVIGARHTSTSEKAANSVAIDLANSGPVVMHVGHGNANIQFLINGGPWRTSVVTPLPATPPASAPATVRDGRNDGVINP